MSDISKMCLLISKINKQNKFLKRELRKFYYGGTDFETMYKESFEKLTSLENDLSEILKKIK